MKYWEIIADKLRKQGWSYGIARQATRQGLLYCVDAQRDGKRFIVKSEQLLTAFLALEAEKFLDVKKKRPFLLLWRDSKSPRTGSK